MRQAERLRRLLPALWLGGLLCVAFIATAAPFEALVAADAGRVVRVVFGREAGASLVLAVALLLLERRSARRAPQPTEFSFNMALVLGVLFCTVAGHYGLQPMVAQARLGAGPLSFGAVHAISLGLFALKTALVAWLAWRAQAEKSS